MSGDHTTDHTVGADQNRIVLTGQAAWDYLQKRYELAEKSGKTTGAIGHSGARSGGPSGAKRSEGRSRSGGAESVSRLLEEKRKHCDHPGDTFHNRLIVKEETYYEARPCRCKCSFCDDCCRSWGIGVRTKVIPIVETFTRVQMWTLTIDPELFNDPRHAFVYEKSNRCISRLIKALRKLGVLHSDRWFCVIEWHKSGYAHWHLLVDASYIPKETVQAIWDSFRPSWAGPKPENRPGFGIVRYSKRDFASKCHAARYATKYLLKPPKSGYPDWVLDYEGQIRRHRSSRGFFPSRSKDESLEPSEDPDSKEACPAGQTEGTDEREWKDPGLVPFTIRERRQRCGQQTVLLARHNRVFDDGSRDSTTEFLGVLKNTSYEDSKEICGVGGFCISALPLTFESVKVLRYQDTLRRLELRLSLYSGEE